MIRRRKDPWITFIKNTMTGTQSTTQTLDTRRSSSACPGTLPILYWPRGKFRCPLSILSRAEQRRSDHTRLGSSSWCYTKTHASTPFRPEGAQRLELIWSSVSHRARPASIMPPSPYRSRARASQKPRNFRYVCAAQTWTSSGAQRIHCPPDTFEPRAREPRIKTKSHQPSDYKSPSK